MLQLLGNGDVLAGHVQFNSLETRQVPSQGHAISSPPHALNPNPPTPAQTVPIMIHSVDSGLVTSSSKQQQGMNFKAPDKCTVCGDNS